MEGISGPPPSISRGVARFSKAIRARNLLFPVPGVDTDGYRTVVDEGDLHIGAELSGPYRTPDGGGKCLTERLIQRNRQFVTGRSDIGRPVAFFGGGHQGELAHDQRLTADLYDAPVHHPGLVIEDPQTGDLAHQPVDVLRSVFRADAQQDQQARPDGRPHPLQR